jgi:hypothetical protein
VIFFFVGYSALWRGVCYPTSQNCVVASSDVWPVNVRPLRVLKMLGN